MTREDFGLEAHEAEMDDLKGTAPLTVKQMDSDERPRERAMKYGIGTLTTPELLAIVIRTGQHGMPITELCRQLMRDNDNSLLRLERRSRHELMLTKGIGTAKALQIEAMMELMRRHTSEVTEASVKKIVAITSSKQIQEHLRPRIANLDHEEVWALLLNRRNEVITEFRVTSGGLSSSVFDVRMIVKRALLEDASGVVMCHNHPSGTLRPSPQDDSITHTLYNACQLLNIRLLDHVIITVGGHYSYNDEGRLVPRS